MEIPNIREIAAAEGTSSSDDPSNARNRMV
jgi:hypothetical protein